MDMKEGYHMLSPSIIICYHQVSLSVIMHHYRLSGRFQDARGDELLLYILLLLLYII